MLIIAYTGEYKTQVFKLISLLLISLHRFRCPYCFPIRWVQKCRAFPSIT